MITVEELNNTNCKCYLLCVGNEAALVDPVRERLDTYQHILTDRRLTLRWILETHMHADHLMLSAVEACDVTCDVTMNVTIDVTLRA